MPLETAHRKYIDSVIEHFFYDLSDSLDFDAVTHLSEKFLAIFTSAFARKPAAAIRAKNEGESDEDYEFFLIATEPRNKITQLENQGSKDANFSIADVQQYILDYAMTKLDEKLIELDPELDGVVATYFKDTHPDADFKEIKFATVKSVQDYDFGEWELPDESGRIYKAKIVQRHIILPNRPVYIQQDLYVKINLPEHMAEYKKENFAVVPDLANFSDAELAEQEDIFLQKTFKIAHEIAEKISMQLMLQYLEEKIASEEKNDEIYRVLNQVERGVHQPEEVKNPEPEYHVIDIVDVEGEDKEEFNSREIDAMLARPPTPPVIASPPHLQRAESPDPEPLNFANLERVALEEKISGPPLMQRNSPPPPADGEGIPPAPPLLHHFPRPSSFSHLFPNLQSGLKLLSYEYYSNLVLAKKITLDYLRKMDLSTTKKFSLNSIQSLLKNGVIEIEYVRFILPPEIKVFENPFYLEKILHDNLFYFELEVHTTLLADILVLPSVIALQKKNPQIPFNVIKKISKSAALLLGDEHWLEYVTLGKVKLEDIYRINPNELKILADEKIIKHLSRQDHISKGLLQIILAPEYSFLRRFDAKYVEALQNITQEHAAKLLIPDVSALITRKIISMKQALALPAQELKALVYMNKLSKSIENGTESSLLTPEFNRVCAKEHFNKFKIIAGTKMFLLKNLKSQIYPQRSYMADRIEQLEKRAPAENLWDEAFNHLVSSANKRLETYEQYATPAAEADLKRLRMVACLFSEKTPLRYEQLLFNYANTLKELHPLQHVSVPVVPDNKVYIP